MNDVIKIWHSSDWHLSFKEDGSIQKPMEEKGWAKGAAAYNGYLTKLIEFSDEHISNQDFLIITGDITHNMPSSKFMFQLQWIRSNFKGKIVLIRGNHDKKWKIKDVRMLLSGFNDIFFIDEGEIQSIGPYTFGCYSYLFKCAQVDERVYHYKEDMVLDLAERTVAHAKNNHTIPVFLSHFPAPRDVAEKIGKLGVKGYLSGHIHSTNVNTGDDRGVDMSWYDILAKPTDNKMLYGCRFSTGTTDSLLNTIGTVFKEIKVLETKMASAASPKKLAADIFGCNAGQAIYFNEVDPFTSNKVEGFICKQKGSNGGALLITDVNGHRVDHQLIYGTPKLAYPYKKNTRDYIDFPNNCSTYTMAPKHNGMNVLFFRYRDSKGAEYISAKSKGSCFLKDGDFGDFLSLTQEVLGDIAKKEFIDATFKAENDLQSMSFELCGAKEPHLVHYDFDIDLKPLFKTYTNGKIKPLDGVSQNFLNSNHLAIHAKACQSIDFESNEKFRQDYGIDIKYEHDHFITEGRVLYVQDDDGFIYDRVMYKIKPKDIEEVHWATFDKNMQGRVIEAVKKVKMSGEAVSSETIKQELDMGGKEWSRFGANVMGYVQEMDDGHKKQLVVLVGMPGSGKSTFAKKLVEKGYIRVNQDILGSRKACKRVVEAAFKDKKKVVIDRCNFDINQRKCWLDLALIHGAGNKTVIVFENSIETCKERVCSRTDHPTVKGEPGSANIVDNIKKMYVAVQDDEPFNDKYIIKDNDATQEEEVFKALIGE